MTGSNRPFRPIANPYIVGNPVEDRQMFYGREDDFNYIRTKVTGDGGSASIALCGTRRAGKTSILLQILNGRLGPAFLPILIDLQMVTVTSDIEFINYLARRITESTDTAASVLPFEYDSDDYGVVSRTFLAALKRLAGSLNEKSLVLMFDEYELFESNIEEQRISPRILHLLGEIVRGDYGVHIIFAGSEPLEDRRPDYWASSLGKSLHRRVSFLSRGDTLRLIGEPVRDKVTYDEGVPESIIGLTAGQPFYTQAICQALVDRLNEQRRRQVDADDVAEIVQGIIENPLPHMVFTFESLDDIEKIAVAALAELNREENALRTADDILGLLATEKTGITLETDKLREALERLFQNDLLQKNADGDGYSFKMDLWRQWVARMHSIWQVLDVVLEDGRSPDDGVIRIARRRRMRMLSGAAALVAIVAAAWGIRLAMEPAGEAGLVGELSHVPVTGDGKSYDSDLSDDGELLVYAHNDGGRYDLRCKQLGSGAERILVPAGQQQRIRTPVVSPDRTAVYYTVIGPGYTRDEHLPYDLCRVPVEGGESGVIAAGVLGRRIDCSPDGGRLAYLRSDGDSIRVAVAQADGSEERTVETRALDQSGRYVLSWSADGTEIFSAERDTATGFLRIHALAETGGLRRDVGEDSWQAILDLHALADGSGLLVVGLPAADLENLNTNLWLLSLDSGSLHQLTNDLTGYYRVSATDDASVFAASYYAFKRSLRILGVDEPDRYRDISTDIVPNSRVVWTNHGHLLANQRIGERVGIVCMTTDGIVSRTIETDVSYVADIAHSPLTHQIAFTSFVGRNFDLWLGGEDGLETRSLSDETGVYRYPEFSVDGKWLVFSHRASPAKPYLLRRLSLADGTSGDLSGTPALKPKVSPDGSLIAADFYDEKSGRYRLGVIPADGGEPAFPECPPNAGLLGWNPQGTCLTCAIREGAAINVWNVPLAGGDARRLTDFPPSHRSIADLSWSETGDSLVVALENVAFDTVLLQRTSR